MVATWPFWAPTASEGIEAALDLADLQPGERLVDLGCGDGRVLIAAHHRGARVWGVEGDPSLAARARETLTAAGVTGEVIEGDLFEAQVDADVVFAYLSPASLQRLRHRLESGARSGTRLVAVGYGVPGCVADESLGSCHLYRLPFNPASAPAETGWPDGGTIFTAPLGRSLLVPLSVVHPGGPVAVALEGPLAQTAQLMVGVDHAEPGERIAVDLRWQPVEAGAFEGAVMVEGVDAFPVIGFVSEGALQLFDIDSKAWARLRELALSGTPWPTLDDLFAAVDGGLEPS